MKLGIFGGTFNPIHYGHLRAAEEVRERFDLAKIIFIPSGDPPIKTQGLADVRHRYKMTGLAIVKNHFFEISDIEYKRPGKSYSVDTIEEFLNTHHATKFYFILGIDTFLDIPNWWQPKRLISLTDFIVIPRASFRFVDLLRSPYIYSDGESLKRLDRDEADSCVIKLKSERDLIALKLPIIDISATEIRQLIREGKSIKYLLPEMVESYIIANKLYI